ncbi:MAG: PAS domain S-box protein [Terrimicrobiaceae bacterium]
MTRPSIRQFLFGSLRGRVILSVACVHALIMTLFVSDVTLHQRSFLYERRIRDSEVLARAISFSVAGWIAAADIPALQKFVEAQRLYPELKFIGIADKQGVILAHSEPSKQRLTLADLPREPRMKIFSRFPDVVDLAVPIFADGQHVGWVRLSVGQELAAKQLARVTRAGILYALMAIVLGSFIAWLLGGWITRRLYAVQDTIKAVRSGNRQARSHLGGADEAADIAREFNSMLDTLDECDVRLRVSEERYRSLIQKLQVAIILYDADGRILVSNPLAQQLLGISADGPAGDHAASHLLHFLHENGSTVPVEEYPINLVLSTKKPLAGYLMGIRIPARDEILWVLVNAEPEFDAEGRVTRALISFVDITERKQAEEVLREAASYNRSLIEACLDPLVAVGRDGKITDGNFAAEQVTGFPRKDLLGRNFAQLFTEPEKAEAAFQEAFHRGAMRNAMLVLKHLSGIKMPVLCNAAAFRDKNGEMIGVFAVARDITEMKRVEQEIQKLNQDLESRVAERTAQLELANKELETFAYSVSHDLRAPLRSIDGFSRILLEDFADKLDENGKKNLEIIRAASQRMAQLIEDILQLSRITRSRIQRLPVDLSAQAALVVDDLKKMEPARSVKIDIEPSCLVFADGNLMRIVLENLLGNAWKFTGNQPNAKIQFGKEIQNGNTVYFVRDNGVGFDMHHASKLFGAFQRLHTTAEFPGTGIGLASVQRIIHRHGGKVWIEARLNEGATAYFTIPNPERTL